jgi:citrate synthase
LYRTLEAIEARISERMAERGTELHANLEFYKGIVYRAAGLPVDFFTAAFAMARVYGYLAHFIESRINNRIIRPAAKYIGEVPA